MKTIKRSDLKNIINVKNIISYILKRVTKNTYNHVTYRHSFTKKIISRNIWIHIKRDIASIIIENKSFSTEVKQSVLNSFK